MREDEVRVKRSLVLLFCLSMAVLLLAACGAPVAPLTFYPAPWQDGEVSTYVVRDANGAELGAAQWTWRRTTDGWTQAYEMNLAGRLDRGEVAVGDDLTMRSAWREVSGTRFEATYAADGITIATTTAGATTTKTLKPTAAAIDNDVSLQMQRALPLAAGYATRYIDVVPTSGVAAPIKLTVTAAETVTVPAGAFPAWRAELDFGSGKHDAWYGQEAPYPLVKYRDRASGAVFELQSLSVGTGGASIVPTPAAGAETESQSVSSVPSLNIPLLLTTFLVQMPLMIVFPLVLGWWIRRRYGVGWGVFGIGALTFIASQVVHIPLNYALGQLGGGRGMALWPLIPLALALGLSAGVCEEGARWVVLRFFAKKTRGWRAGLQFGAGHGGAEAIIVGVVALVNVVVLIALRSVSPSALGLGGANADQLAAAQAAYWRTAAYLPVVGGLERVFAITVQIALATLVMRSVTRGRPLYLLAAIAFHAAIDAWAVWAAQNVSVWVIEGVVALSALFGLWLIWRLREAPPAAEPEQKADPVPTAADLIPRDLSPAELARRAEASRYE